MSNRAKIREEAKKLNPIDDPMFRKMAEDKEFCEEILRVILEDDDHQRRVRYNGAILTTNVSDPGIKFENVPDVTVVFISKFDMFDSNFPLYHVDRVVRETGKTVDNGFEEVYVNTKVKDGSEVSELMEVFVKDDAYNSKFPKTSDGKRRYKETEKGVNTMCEIVERLTNEARTDGINEGITEGITRGTFKTLYTLVEDGILTVSDAAKRAGVTEGVFEEKTQQFRV
jgi:hypothetical protein